MKGRLLIATLAALGLPGCVHLGSPARRSTSWEIGSPKMAAENRIRRQYGIRPLDSGWRWIDDFDRSEYEKDDGTVGSEYEKRGPYGTETKCVARDRRTGELVSDQDVYLSGRTFVEEWEDGHPTLEENLVATFYYRTAAFGQIVDGDWYPSVDYSGNDASLSDAASRPEKHYTVGEVDGLVSAMRKKAGRSGVRPVDLTAKRPAPYRP